MRPSFILPLLLGSALCTTGSMACGGNVVVDGGGGGAGGAGGAATISTTTATSTATGVGGLGGVGGAIPPGSSTGNGLPPSCITCAARLLAFEEGVVPDNLPLCTGAAATANAAVNACACADRCASECAANACIAQPVSTPCLDCLPTSCAQQVATCMNN